MPSPSQPTACPFAHCLEAVARELLGPPNSEYTRPGELRWGTRGSLSVNLRKGVWRDHEAGTGGGTLQFVMDQLHLDKPGALKWLAERGHIEQPARRTPSRGKVVAIYPYTDEAGTRLYEAVRFEPKGFAQRKSVKEWSIKGVRLVLFHLPDLLAAIAAGRVVFITEGEKGVLALEALGLAATCSPMGANKWNVAGYSQAMTGADVVILPDQDRPGRDHAKQVAEALQGHAKRIRTVPLPDLEDGQDVADWIAAGGTADKLMEMAAATPTNPGKSHWTAEVVPLARYIAGKAAAEAGPEWPDTMPEPTPAARLRVLSEDDLLATPDRTYLLDGLLAPGELSVWWGSPKVGKSFLLLRIARGLSQGVGIWGRKAEPVPVLYILAEGKGGIKGRILALRGKMGPAPHFHTIAQTVNLFDPTADLTELIGIMLALRIKFLVVDTHARTMVGGNENATADTNLSVSNFDKIREGTGAHVSLICHDGWQGEHPRGSQALVGAADLVVKVAESEGRHSMFVTYAKDDDSGYTLGFALESFELPAGPEGQPRETRIAVEAEAPPMTTAMGGKTKRLGSVPANDLLMAIRSVVGRGQGFNVKHAADGFLCPTITRKSLRAELEARDWYDDGDDGEGGENPTFEERRETRKQMLSTHLKYLRTYDKIGFDTTQVWLAEAPKDAKGGVVG